LPRFVIQKHCRNQQVHWDLMLEKENSLATWQVPEPPEDWPGQKLTCRHIFNHRLIYLTYQGPLGNNRGEVKIAASGRYQPKEITENCWKLTLNGDKISGPLSLQQQQNDLWLMEFTGECSF